MKELVKRNVKELHPSVEMALLLSFQACGKGLKLPSPRYLIMRLRLATCSWTVQCLYVLDCARSLEQKSM